jgi:hypothetical protein
MSKRKAPTSPPDKGNGYTVGYCKPPTHSQFRPGQTGNPAGRRKGVHNLMTDVRRTLRVPVSVREGGRSRKISTQEGALMMLREKALKGDQRALDRVIELACRFNNEPAAESAQALSIDDQAILAAYTAELTAATPSSLPIQTRRRERVKMRRRQPDEEIE